MPERFLQSGGFYTRASFLYILQCIWKVFASHLFNVPPQSWIDRWPLTESWCLVIDVRGLSRPIGILCLFRMKPGVKLLRWETCLCHAKGGSLQPSSKSLNPLESPYRKVLLWKSGRSLAWLGCACAGTCGVPMASISTPGLSPSISVFNTMTCVPTPACLLFENKSLGWVKCHICLFSFSSS